MENEGKMEKKVTNSKNMLKFVLGSAFGALMFLVPIPYEDSFTTLLEFIKNFLKSLFGGALPYMLAIMVVCSVIAIGVDGIRKRGRA